MEGQFKISRIDINYMYSLSTLENVRAWLYAAEFKAKTRHGRACGKGGTVYLGKNSRRWSLKFYSKYDEHTSGKKGHQMADEFVKAGLLDWSKDKLRIELTLRTTELIDLNLTLGNSWNIETPNKLFSDYVGKIEMNQNTILTDEKIINLPRKIQSTYLLWKQGANIKEMLPKPTFYRHRKELLSFGIDINFYCESPYSNNVVPLVRTIEAKPAKIPSWVYEKGLIFDYVAYLSDILGGYVSGSFNNSEAVISDDSLKGSSRASNYINRIGDILVYYGTKEDIAILKTLVTSLDTMSDEVVVSGYVFEVQTSQSDGSGILLAAKILSDKFNISVWCCRTG
ncbi:phage/plasmid replication protein, gene II/X family [Klebsiella pneumoniae]|uniref:Phage/plasmid replication protein, gene II/X family n=1 Tax=Klebsiella pneumoniae TaxID=573 RepID=A0A3S5DGV9_KLEPN|nr:phage/plasmid replication protein, gene II/X family [Klebsiella pneumoniae]